MKEEFYPYTSSSGNVNGEIAYLRDVFLNAELDYFKELLKNEKIREQFILLMIDYSPEKLYAEAVKRINSIELGEVKEEKLDIVEGEITLLLAAIQDKVLIKELILTPNMTEGHEKSR